MPNPAFRRWYSIIPMRLIFRWALRRKPGMQAMITEAKRALPTTTTGIGSLPHHNVDAALAYSLRFGIPFLPQIPMRNAWEFMIAQALEDLPGLRVDDDGTATLD